MHPLLSEKVVFFLLWFFLFSYPFKSLFGQIWPKFLCGTEVRQFFSCANLGELTLIALKVSYTNRLASSRRVDWYQNFEILW